MHRLTMAAVGNLESVGNKLFAFREWRFGRVREKLICILRSYCGGNGKFPATRHMRTTFAGRRAVPPGTRMRA